MSEAQCFDFAATQHGCLLLAKEIVKIMKKDLRDRLNEPGRCEICLRALPVAQRVVQLETGKYWEFAPGTKRASKVAQMPVDDGLFINIPVYYCDRVLEPWATITDMEPWIKKDAKVSPIDVAEAMVKKKTFDLKQLALSRGSKPKRSAMEEMERLR